MISINLSPSQEATPVIEGERKVPDTFNSPHAGVKKMVAFIAWQAASRHLALTPKLAKSAVDDPSPWQTSKISKQGK